MARKWDLFTPRMEFLLVGKVMKKTTILLFFILGIFLTTAVGILPVQSQSAPSSPQELVEKAKENYKQGEYNQSITQLEQAAAIFAQQGDQRNQGITLGNLANLYQEVGQLEKAETTIKTSLELLGFPGQNNENTSQEELSILAPTLDIYGSILFKIGKAQQALEIWQQAEAIYQQTGNFNGSLGNKINQVQALQNLGLYQQALGTIRGIEQSVEKFSPEQKIKVWRSLGETFRSVGELKKSEEFLEKSLSLAQESNNSSQIAATQLSLGNTYRALGDVEKARINTGIDDYNVIPWRCSADKGYKNLNALTSKRYTQAKEAYAQAQEKSSNPEIITKAKLNLLNLLIEESDFVGAQNLYTQIKIKDLPLSRIGVYTKLNLARNLACLQEKSGQDYNTEIQQLLDLATQEAQSLQDQQALSYAFGNNGGYFEYLGAKQNNPAMLKKAEEFTQKAILQAQPSVYPSAAYQWQWQLARLLEAQGNVPEAIATYKQAVKTLEIVRSDLKVINTDVQFSFRDNVEPIYRKLIDLIMSNQTDPNLQEVLTLLDGLQLSELENFLRCDLSSFVQTQQPLEASDPEAGYIYPIILRDRIEVLYKLPNKPFASKATMVNQQEVEKVTGDLQRNLARPDRTEEVIQESEQLYNWIIKPIELELGQISDVQTLVFVLDGSLRNIPMTILYNQGTYLIQKYVVATVPSRRLFDPRARQNQLRVLTAGVSEAQKVEGLEFRELPNVPRELESISVLSGQSTQPLLNQQFTDGNLEQEINTGDFPIVHIATHGVFSSNPEETFILSWGKKVSVRELDRILRIANSEKTIELLVLSACQTAQGNKRAALGLAGVAAQARVRTTLASLWQVDDVATADLISTFYEQLKNGKNIGEALREAELEFLKPNSKEVRPHYWAPFVVVGNWK